jgi:hypothetical protein
VARRDRAAPRKILFTAISRAKDAIAMNDQSTPPNWFLRPQSGPYWMPNAVWNGGLTPPARDRFDPSTWTPSTWDPDTWNPNRFSSSEWLPPADSNGGILGTFGQQVDQWTSPTKTDATAWPASPVPSASIPPQEPPTVPLSLPHGWHHGSVNPPAAPVPPATFAAWLRNVLSDRNVRYYAGPGFYQALQKVAALAQLLPGSGTVQSTQDGAEAGQELEAGNYGKAAAHLGLGAVNAGLDWLPGGKVLAIPLGMGARTFPRARVKIAEEMEAAGYTAPQVVRETGLYRGKEGKWRFEASDADYRVRPDVGVLDQEGYRVAPLFEQLVHPVLKEAYPQFANITSRIKIDPSQRRPDGGFNPLTNTIRIIARNAEEAEKIGIHELVHLIQRHEGFARGGHFMEFVRAGVELPEALQRYKQLAGEIEALNAEKRLRWSDVQRRAKPFPETEDLPRDQQIIRYFD